MSRTGPSPGRLPRTARSEEHTSELQSRLHLVCRLLLEKKKIQQSRLNHTAQTNHITLTRLCTQDPNPPTTLLAAPVAEATHVKHMEAALVAYDFRTQYR